MYPRSCVCVCVCVCEHLRETTQFKPVCEILEFYFCLTLTLLLRWSRDVLLLTLVCSRASCCFAFYHSEHLNSAVTAVSSVQGTKKQHNHCAEHISTCLQSSTMLPHVPTQHEHGKVGRGSSELLNCPRSPRMQHEMLSVLSDALFERNLPPVWKHARQRESQGQEVKVGTRMEPKHSVTRSAFIFHAGWLALAQEQ